MDSAPLKISYEHPKLKILTTIAYVFKNSKWILSKSWQKNHLIPTKIVEFLDNTIFFSKKNIFFRFLLKFSHL